MQIAKHDCYGTDGVGVRRFIRSGDEIPPGLDVDRSDVIERDAPVPPAAGPVDYDKQAPEDLQAEADRRGLTVEGTGANGKVLKKDLVAALEANDGS